MNGNEEEMMIVRLTLQGAAYFVKLSAEGSERFLAMLKALADEKKQLTPGQVKMRDMIKSGKPSTVFSVPERYMKDFAEAAKTYGLQYVAAKNKDGVCDLLVYLDDAHKFDRIAEKIGMAKVKPDGSMDINTAMTEEEKNNAMALTPEEVFTEKMISMTEKELEETPNLKGVREEDRQFSDSSLNMATEADGIIQADESADFGGRKSVIKKLKENTDDMEKTMDMFSAARRLAVSMVSVNAPEEVKNVAKGWTAGETEYDPETGERLYRGKRAEEMTDADRVQYMVDNEMEKNGRLSEATIKSMYEAGYAVDEKGMVKESGISLSGRERKMVADMMTEPVRDREAAEAAARRTAEMGTKTAEKTVREAREAMTNV